MPGGRWSLKVKEVLVDSRGKKCLEEVEKNSGGLSKEEMPGGKLSLKLKGILVDSRENSLEEGLVFEAMSCLAGLLKKDA
ncbi:hypothetical protein KM043_003509 [Ampulex compressa]|nr:hypothetical protein KM043_003509 [Ampulex compressa]